MDLSTLKRRVIDAVKAYFRRGWTWESVMNFDNVSPFIHLHLRQFYLTLMCTLASSSIGLLSNMFLNFGSWITVIMFVGSITYFCRIPTWRQKRRAIFLIVAAFFGGASISLLIDSEMTKAIITSIVMELGIATGCFLLGSMMTKERHSLYSFGVLACFVLVLLKILVNSVYYRGYLPPWTYKVCVGIMCYTNYMIVYSQELVDRARATDDDYVRHVLAFIPNFPGVVVHVFVILWRQEVTRAQRRRTD